MRVGSLALMLVSLLPACSRDGGGGGELVKKVIGTDGGVITSSDGVLTIALKPGALAESTEISIIEDDDPPDVFAPAYRVRPNVDLDVAATVTYRHELPADATGFAVGAIDPDDFAAGTGQWTALPVLRIDVDEQLVQGSDMQLSMFYALLDEGGGGVTETTIADGTSAEGETGTGETTGSDASATTTASNTTNTTTSDTSDTGDGSTGEDTGVVYPPECADVMPRAEYTIILATGMPIFPGTGSEDIAMVGDGTFVGRNGDELMRYDVGMQSGATYATGFFDVSLGTKFRADGDLLTAVGVLGQILRVTPAGVTSVWAQDLAFPNGLWPDADGNVWVTEYMGSRVIRINADMTIDTIADGAAAELANGVVFDPVRSQAFWTKYGASELWRAPIAGDGAAGNPVMVTDLDGYSDGIALDACGNVYVVDENMGMGSRLDRVFLDGGAELVMVEEIADSGQLFAPVANPTFGFGTGMYDTWLFLVGDPGFVYLVDVGVAGEPIAPVG